MFWRSHRESNPVFNLERVVSYPFVDDANIVAGLNDGIRTRTKTFTESGANHYTTFNIETGMPTRIRTQDLKVGASCVATTLST